MATSGRMVDVATRHQVYLERLKSGAVRDFTKELPHIETAIREVLGTLDMPRLRDLTQRKLSAVLADLRQTQVELYAASIERLTEQLTELAGYEAQFEKRALEGSVRRLELRAVEAERAFALAKRRPLSATGELLAGFLNSHSQRAIGRMDGLLRRAYAEGWTNQQAIQAVRGTRAAGYKDGLMARLGRDAEAVVRTSMQHTAAAGRMATWERNADVIKGYRWVSTLDSKTTPQCRSLDGQVFELDRGPMPPIHVNCRSTTVADIDGRLSFLDTDATRSSAQGYVPANTTYYEWLKTQPAAFQDSALGPARGQLFRDGGLSAERFAQLNLNRNFEPLTLEQMRALEPVAFSKADL